MHQDDNERPWVTGLVQPERFRAEPLQDHVQEARVGIQQAEYQQADQNLDYTTLTINARPRTRTETPLLTITRSFQDYPLAN